MPPEPVELWARKLELKEVLWLSDSWPRALLPPGCLDGGATAACISQLMVFCMGRNSRHSLGSGCPGRGKQGYSLGVMERTGFEAEACHSSKIV